MQYTQYLPGTWHIIASTFKMWTSGKKTNPSITYSIIQSHPLRIHDEVTYQTQNKSKSIVGYDTLDIDQFNWRGKGILKLFSSKWDIIYIDDEVLIINFSATLATPSGMDILLRNKQNADSYKSKILNHPEKFNLNTKTIQKFKWLF
ncbi:hypothetical protein [Staphylococcus xylosus]|uniref:hypothetical protein n=1 Tax=Staphylococcus xylosus TaxID=1288 RepID=UPI001F19530B|nr:hypothetical protein [Staphylococcus xylosus]MCE7782022.1 hypothetical protein [Staphylococcus xylosus]